jgi:hypothetical protein
MGGKSSTTTQQVQIPPEVMARYRSVNQRAETVGGTPFQQYGTSASDFVAPINPTQQAGIQGIGNVQNAALPFYGAGAQMTMGGAQGVGPVSGQDINQYMSPYLGSVVGTTLANLSQEQGIQRQQQIGDSIKAGAFGGDRAGLAAANLARQQGMAYGSTAANLLNQGYGQALGAAQAYQGVEAQNLARQLQAGQQIAGLGTGLTNTQIGAGQALLNAGTAEQQTEQAGKSALFNQFQQERSYPFQVAQFLANIAMGTGALSGSTTTTTQPVPFFSDPRLKENMREIGQTHDGMPLYAFNYKGRPGETQIGLNADEVEQVKPEAVGLAGGYKTVDYDAATRPRGGLDPASSMGGAVVDLEPHEYRENFAAGGAPDFASSLAQLYAQFGSPQGAQPGGGLAGPYGGRASYVPQANLPVGQLRTADTRGIIRSPTSMAQNVMGTATGIRDFGKTANELYEMGGTGLGAVRNATRQGPSRAAPAAPAPSAAAPPAASIPETEYPVEYRARGGLVGYADGGDVEDPMKSYGAPQGGLDIPTEQPDIKPLNTPTGMPGAPKSGMSDVMDVAKFAASLFAMSDERVKDGMQRVGQLDNGLPVYKYSIGDGPTQIGLSAQEAGGLHPGAAMADDRGILHLDYDRATRAYGGGLDPRAGYADGGGPSFEDALKRTLQFEGGYTVDTGGPTMMGISSRANPDVDLDRVSRDPQYKAGIYRERYWNPIGADAMDSRMAPVAFDTAVNLGVGGARRLLEQAGGDPGKLLDLRQQHYDNLIARNPEKYGAYERGWRARNDALRQGLGGSDGDVAATGARNAQGSGTPPGARQKGFIENLLPSKVDPRTGEESTDWKKIIIPALTGLGAMASSPSLYAGSAVLQGLGAGAQAYAGLEKQQQDIEESKSREAVGYASTANTRFMVKDGIPVIAIRQADGTERYLDYGAYRAANSPPIPTGGRFPPGMERFEYKPGSGAAAPKTGEPAKTSAAEGPAAPGAPKAPEAPKVGVPKINLDQKDQADADGWNNVSYSTGTSTLSKYKDIYTPQETLAAALANNRLPFGQLASQLASLPSTGPLSSGAQTAITVPLVDAINGALSTAGISSTLSADLSNFEAIKKEVARLASDQSSGADQRAFSALTTYMGALPNARMTRDGFAKQLATMKVESQAQLDKAEYFRQFKDRVQRSSNREPLASGSYYDLNARFRERNTPAMYADAKKKIERMYLDSVTGADGKPLLDPRTKSPITVADYVYRYGARMRPEDVEKITGKYGDGVLRYFGV